MTLLACVVLPDELVRVPLVGSFHKNHLRPPHLLRRRKASWCDGMHSQSPLSSVAFTSSGTSSGVVSMGVGLLSDEYSNM